MKTPREIISEIEANNRAMRRSLLVATIFLVIALAANLVSLLRTCL